MLASTAVVVIVAGVAVAATVWLDPLWPWIDEKANDASNAPDHWVDARGFAVVVRATFDPAVPVAAISLVGSDTLVNESDLVFDDEERAVSLLTQPKREWHLALGVNTEDGKRFVVAYAHSAVDLPHETHDGVRPFSLLVSATPDQVIGRAAPHRTGCHVTVASGDTWPAMTSFALSPTESWHGTFGGGNDCPHHGVTFTHTGVFARR